MNKVLFLGLAATALMSSCSSDEVLESVMPQAISFEAPFLDKGTRANNNDMVVGQNFTKFYVYGTHDAPTTNIYDGTEITKYNGFWTSKSNPKYWEDNKTYNFIGYTNGNEVLPNVTYTASGNSLKIADYVNTTGTKDLIVSNVAEVKITNNSKTYDTPVSLTFGHKLAKVFFTFKTDAVAGQELTISNIKLSGVMSKGTYATSGNKWSAQSAEESPRVYSYEGNVVVTPSKATGETLASASSVERYMIPQTVQESTFIVSFDAQLKDLTSKETANHSFTVTLPHNQIAAWEINNVYNYTAKITREDITLGNPITFTPSVGTWETTQKDENELNPAPAAK